MYGPARRLGLPPLLLALLAASCAPGRTQPAAFAALPLPPMVGAPIIAGPGQLVPLPDGTTAFTAIVDELRRARRAIALQLYESQRRDLAAPPLPARARSASV